MVKYDAVIIGGGVIGTAAAYYGSKAGLSIALAERNTVASGASGLNPGTVSLATKHGSDVLRLARWSLDEFRRLIDAGGSFSFVQSGSLVVFETAHERAFAASQAHSLVEAGVKAEIIEAARAHSIQPLLEGAFLGAIWSPADAIVDAAGLTRWFATEADRHGAVIMEHTKIASIERNGDAGWQVQASSGEQGLQARWVVNAAGVHAPGIGRMLGLEHDIVPRKGQLLETTPIEGVAPVRVTSIKELLKKHGHHVPDMPGPEVAIGLTPQSGNRVYLGGTQEDAGLDGAVDPATVATIALRAAGLFPRIADAGIVRAWSGFRPAARRGSPIVEVAAPGYVVAGGHGGDGIALAPVTGRYVAALLTGEAAGRPIADFARSLS